MILDNLDDIFLTPEKFHKEILIEVNNSDSSYISAILKVCDDKDISPDDLLKLKLISPKLMLLLEEEGISNGQLKAVAKLKF